MTDVHVFGRRGPAQMKFTPLELRELAHSRDVDIVLYEEDFQFDAASEEAMEKNAQTKVMMKTLRGWLEDQKTNEQTASRRLHLHFLQSPHEILGEDGKVVGLRMERNKLDGNGGIIGTGEYVDYPYRLSTARSATLVPNCPKSVTTTSAASSPTLRVASWTRTARSFPACTHPVGLSAAPSA